MANQDGKWRGTVTSIIPAPVDKVWEILSDFGGFQKRFPQMFLTCETIEGEVNKPGSLRSLSAPLPDGSTVVATERLLALDDVNHTTDYTVESITLGWTGYRGHLVAERYENDKTSVIWSFEMDPLSGKSEQEVVVPQMSLLKQILLITEETLSK